jgi:DNA gyrase inhibitor GyrI
MEGVPGRSGTFRPRNRDPAPYIVITMTFKMALLIGLGLAGGLVLLGAGAWIYAVSTVEQPKYTAVVTDGAIELRDYPTLVMAEVTRQGDRGDAVRSGFSPLAAYIFAKNREGETVSMTAPVLQAAGPSDTAWVIRFVMPSKYTLETLPKAAGDDVRLIEVPAGRRAAIRFSGVATDTLIAMQEALLRAWLAARSITPIGPPTYAYYNDPFTPGPLRRNEVLFGVPPQ